MEPTLRRATPEDAANLAACVTRAYAPYAARIPDLPDVADGLDTDIAENLVWVADENGKILGGLVLIVEGTTAKLANVAVDPRANGKGLGRQLIATAEQACRDRGIAILTLSTHAQMPENVALYEHLGWHVTGRSGNKVTMEKTLPA